MLIHITIRYAIATSPVDSPEGVGALVGFATWMRTQTEFPDVEARGIWFAAEKPPTAYAVFEAPSADAMRAYLSGMPQPQALELHAVRPLEETLEEGRQRLVEWGAAVPR